MKSSIDLATQEATEMKTLSKHHIEAIEKAKTEDKNGEEIINGW